MWDIFASVSKVLSLFFWKELAVVSRPDFSHFILAQFGAEVSVFIN